MTNDLVTISNWPLCRSAGACRAPGRVNLLGEHTDYNEGFVLPVAIDRELRLTWRARSDRWIVLHSRTLGRQGAFSLDELKPGPSGDWLNYPRGVAAMLSRAGCQLVGLSGVIDSDVPAGAGMSSSAALEVATALALTTASGVDLDRLELARLCQQAEHEYAGVACGIMDQVVVACARAGHALFLDCRSLAWRPVPLPENLAIVVCDTGVRRRLNASAYNVRRAQCQEGVRLLRAHLPGIEALRDVTSAQLATLEASLPSTIARRCAHVVSENERVLAAVAALDRGDLETIGNLFYASHESLRDLHEVSCPELDALVEIASSTSGAIGARLTGAGFGGCTVNLVHAEAVPDFAARVRHDYAARAGREATVYICRAVGGASLLD